MNGLESLNQKHELPLEFGVDFGSNLVAQLGEMFRVEFGIRNQLLAESFDAKLDE